MTTAWGQHLQGDRTLSPQAWASGQPGGICRVTQALSLGLAIRKPEENSKQLNPAVQAWGLGAGRPKLKSQLLSSLAGDFGKVPQTLQTRLYVSNMETAPMYFIESRGGDELSHV